MNLLTMEHISKTYGEKPVLQDIGFSLQDGEKAGLIGVNGTGKSTLLKLIAGIEEPDQGRITLSNRVVVRYLPQTPVFDREDTVLSYILRENATKDNEWSVEAEAKSMLTKLGITNFTAPCATLSGGQKKRLALVSVLLYPSDILVLDEPTNHLDNGMADWLEETLRKRKTALVMVTHDRYFLDSVVNRIVEIDRGRLYSYSVNYSGYLEARLQREESAQAAERKREALLRNELKWVRRGARARSTKQKARLARFEELAAAEGPEADAQVEINGLSSRLGKTVLEASHLSKTYGERTLIQDFTYLFTKGQRVGILGPNGCGKTTLMKLLSGQLPPDGGGVTVGQTVVIGYYTQEIAVDGGSPDGMDPQQRVIDYIREEAEIIRTPEGSVSASAMLERFLFPGSLQYSPIGKLSGGEKRRLYLLRVLMKAPNVLLLDEPTNDLDIATLTVLEDYLDQFPGVAVIVSHDRYFLDRTVHRILAFEEDGNIRQYEGGYTDYSRKEAEEENVPGAVFPNVKTLNRDHGGRGMAAAENSQRAGNRRDKLQRKPRFTYKEQKDYDTIGGEIARLEAAGGELEKQMQRYTTDYVRLNELTLEKEEIDAQLEEKMERWVYLEELAERIKEAEEEWKLS